MVSWKVAMKAVHSAHYLADYWADKTAPPKAVSWAEQSVYYSAAR